MIFILPALSWLESSVGILAKPARVGSAPACVVDVLKIVLFSNILVGKVVDIPVDKAVYMQVDTPVDTPVDMPVDIPGYNAYSQFKVYLTVQ